MDNTNDLVSENQLNRRIEFADKLAFIKQMSTRHEIPMLEAILLQTQIDLNNNLKYIRETLDSSLDLIDDRLMVLNKIMDNH